MGGINGDSYYLRFSRLTLFAFFGCRPTGKGLTRRPSSFSSLLMKLSFPKGLPVCVLKRILLICLSSIPPASSFRHCFADIISFQIERFSSSIAFSSSTCAAALDHWYFQGTRQIFARTGLSSTYFDASSKPCSSRAHE